MRPTERAIWALVFAAGCAPYLPDVLERSNGNPGAMDDLAGAGVLDTGMDLTETREVVVDATNEQDWQRYDFERVGLVEDDLPWDIAIQRFCIHLNGGVNGDGGVEAVTLEDVLFDEVTLADVPPDGDNAWRTDVPDPEDGYACIGAVFGDWYDYDSTSHILTPKPRVTIVRTVEGLPVKVEILDYYDDAGSSGYFRFLWAELAR
jgi:hypothetical protein